MAIQYGNPALDAELSYRREQLMQAGSHHGRRARVRLLPRRRAH